MRVLVLVIFVFLCSSEVLACSCVTLKDKFAETVKWQVDTAGIVFEGKASDYFTTAGSDRASVRFTVDKVWKGDVTPEFVLATDTIITEKGAMQMNSCDYPFGKDATYIIFATKTKKGWMTGDCSGTTQVRGRDWDQEILKLLGPWSEPKKTEGFFFPLQPYELLRRPTTSTLTCAV